MIGLIGKKLGMTNLFGPNGGFIPVTAVEVGPCYVTQVKTPERDGYAAVQVGFGTGKVKHLTRAEQGHLAQAGLPPLRILREFPVAELSGYQPGQALTVGIFSPGQRVHVTATSKGRGFAGVVKRHGFAGGDATHGSMTGRLPGSIGSSADPSRVWKNQGLPGRMGGNPVTIRNLEVIQVDVERNRLLLRGAIPGPPRGIVYIRPARDETRGQD